MAEIFADRFVPAGSAWIDLASGDAVRLHVRCRFDGAAALVWNDRCCTLSLLRHPVLNELLDYGHADVERAFEAYATSSPLSHGASTVMLEHGARFLEGHGISITRDLAQLALRHVDRSTSSTRRPVGIALQRRRAVEACADALVDAVPGGVTTIDVIGDPGSGLRTVRACVARVARLQGYVPVCARVLSGATWLTGQLHGRHVCLLVDDNDNASERTQASRLLSDLGLSTPRRHVVFRFRRAARAAPGAICLEPMGVTAMISMVFVDGNGPDAKALAAAARRAEGNPARFLRALRAYLPEPAARSPFVVHESSPPYVLQPPGPQSAVVDIMREGAGPAAVAGARASRLASRGRHGVAIRLLTRATRVLEARRNVSLAAEYAVALGWILRDRGRAGEAMEQFVRARRLAPDARAGLQAAIAIAVVWTDECRFAESEAALRAALGAAELVSDADATATARVALARNLVWQRRVDEAEVALTGVAGPAIPEELRVRTSALMARIHTARKDYRRALAASADALERAGHGCPRLISMAERAAAAVHSALGDLSATRTHVCRGLRAAAAAHLPLDALRLRGALLIAATGKDDVAATRLASHVRWALRHRPLPALLRNTLDASIASPRPTAGIVKPPAGPALEDLQQFIEQAHNAADDVTAIAAVSRTLCDTLRAATVHIVTAGPERRTLGHAGRPWSGDLTFIERVIAGGTHGRDASGPWRGAEPIRYGNETVAVLACRWPAGVSVDEQRSTAVLRAAALALATSVRGVLDKARPAEADTVWRDLIGSSTVAEALRAAIARAARAPFPVLIEGESGSGKELVARAIHRLGARRERRLCAVNCAALSEELLEAELFGHTRGAFTGAVGERAGLFEEADGGTLFLDEVGELSPRAQAKLLRVLQDGEVRRVGENLPRRVDPRVIAATNRQLDGETDAGRFRADLKFRLDVVRISVPPLRDRADDIPQLAEHFWDEAARRVGSRASLTPETVTALTRFDWPGNVRQLQNVIATLAVHAPRRGRVTPSLLPAHVARSSAVNGTTFDAARQEFERRFVIAALARAGGQRARAARAIGVTRQGLAKMMKRLGLD
jgi:DNA-binding NtrC family response regulator/tetratricopeptide (TPR) repeat protein